LLFCPITVSEERPMAKPRESTLSSSAPGLKLASELFLGGEFW
jgi:hypothetical protein